MAKKKWYVVTVGKDIGVFDTWLETASLTKQVPNAIFQGFNTEEEAHRAFRKAQEIGATRIVGNSAPQSDVPSLFPTVHEHPLGGTLMPLAVPLSKQSPQRPSPRPPSPPPIFHDNVTYTRGPPSSPTSSSRSSRRILPRVVVDTPPYLNSYPSDAGETRSRRRVEPGAQPFSPVDTNPQPSPRIVVRTSPNIKSTGSGGHPQSPDIAQSPLSSPLVLTPTNASPPIRPVSPSGGGTGSVSLNFGQCNHVCPLCGPMVPSGRLQGDPRSPIPPMASLTSQINYLFYGRPTPSWTTED